MEYVIGVLLILSFFALAYYCVKGYNLMIGFLLITIVWTVLPLVGTLFAGSEFLAANPTLQFGGEDGNSVISMLNAIYQAGPEGWGSTLVNVCWGAWFGRVLMETGIASTIIRKTVELGGDRPIITIALLDIVTGIIFTAMMGAGPVIAIGVIVLPILMSLGIPKAIAMFTFMASVSAGMYLNPVLHGQLRAFVLASDAMPEFSLGWFASRFGYYAFAITLVVTILLTAIFLKAKGRRHAWAAQSRTASQVQKDAPFYTLILPVVPVILKLWLDFSVIGGFVIAGFLALFLCGRMKGGFKENCQLVNKLYYDGVVDTAALVGFLLTLPMFNKVAGYAAPYFKVVIGNLLPTNEYVLCALFAVLIITAFFRGPLTLFGCGAATLGVLANVGSFSVPFLFTLFCIPATTVNVGSCITQSWIAWGLAYTKVDSKDFLKMSMPFAYITSILLYVVCAFTMTGLGAEWFWK